MSDTYHPNTYRPDAATTRPNGDPFGPIYLKAEGGLSGQGEGPEILTAQLIAGVPILADVRQLGPDGVEESAKVGRLSVADALRLIQHYYEAGIAGT